MKTEDIKAPSLWLPEQDRERLAILGKLAEEVNELGAAVARCIIQGAEERDPETGERNTEKLQDEIADVYAMSELAIEHFALDLTAINTRAVRKERMKRRWHEMIREHEAAAPATDQGERT